jgi:hypothetical protein
MNNEYDEPKMPIWIILGGFIFSLAMFYVGAVLYQSNYGEGNEYISVTIEAIGFILLMAGVYGFWNCFVEILRNIPWDKFDWEYIGSTRLIQFIARVDERFGEGKWWEEE